MLIIISPSKNLNENPVLNTNEYSIPEFLEESSVLIEKLKKYSGEELSRLMSINPKLSALNVRRFQQWSVPFTPQNAFPAILMFSGEVYNGLKAGSLHEKDMLYAQDHLRILSGLHGLLRPLDLMKPYRLEMGTKITIGRTKDLYEFWGDSITLSLNRVLQKQKQKVLVNLASNEYFNALNKNMTKGKIIQCTFKESTGDTFKFFTVYGKHARGLMTRFIIRNRIENLEDLKHFEEEGYFYNVHLSDEDNLVFTR